MRTMMPRPVVHLRIGDQMGVQSSIRVRVESCIDPSGGTRLAALAGWLAWGASIPNAPTTPKPVDRSIPMHPGAAPSRHQSQCMAGTPPSRASPRACHSKPDQARSIDQSIEKEAHAAATAARRRPGPFASETGACLWDVMMNWWGGGVKNSAHWVELAREWRDGSRPPPPPIQTTRDRKPVLLAFLR